MCKSSSIEHLWRRGVDRRNRTNLVMTNCVVLFLFGCTVGCTAYLMPNLTEAACDDPIGRLSLVDYI
jgi:hypothetical protein